MKRSWVIISMVFPLYLFVLSTQAAEKKIPWKEAAVSPEKKDGELELGDSRIAEKKTRYVGVNILRDYIVEGTPKVSGDPEATVWKKPAVSEDKKRVEFVGEQLKLKDENRKEYTAKFEGKAVRDPDNKGQGPGGGKGGVDEFDWSVKGNYVVCGYNTLKELDDLPEIKTIVEGDIGKYNIQHVSVDFTLKEPENGKYQSAGDLRNAYVKKIEELGNMSGVAIFISNQDDVFVFSFPEVKTYETNKDGICPKCKKFPLYSITAEVDSSKASLKVRPQIILPYWRGLVNVATREKIIAEENESMREEKKHWDLYFLRINELNALFKRLSKIKRKIEFCESYPWDSAASRLWGNTKKEGDDGSSEYVKIRNQVTKDIRDVDKSGKKWEQFDLVPADPQNEKDMEAWPAPVK